MTSGAAKNTMLEQKRFFHARVMPMQSVANGDRRRVEIELRQCDICWSWSSNRWNL